MHLVFLSFLLLISNSFASSINTKYSLTLESIATKDSGNFNYVPNFTSLSGKLHMDYKTYSAHLEIGTEHSPIKQLWLSKYVSLKDNNIAIRLGSDDTFFGFYTKNSSMDAIGSIILPQGVYAYDFVYGGFSTIVGASMKLDNTSSDDWMHTFKLIAGKPYINDKDLTEMSLFSGTTSSDVDINMNKGYAISYSLSYKDKHIFMLSGTSNRFSVDKEWDWKKPESLPMMFHLASPYYKVDILRYGIKTNIIPNVTIITEGYKLFPYADIDLPGSRGGYITAQTYINNFILGVGFSKAFPDDNIAAQDTYFTILYREPKWSAGIEHHLGKGSDAWIIEGRAGKESWQSTIFKVSLKLL